MAKNYNENFSGIVKVKRITIYVITAIIIGVCLAFLAPRFAPELGKITGEYTAIGDAATQLGQLKVVDNSHNIGHYERDVFGYQKTDEDGNGCNIREDILARDLMNRSYTTPGGCIVKTGVLKDPYTGKTIDFVRGPKTSTKVQIDHVVALHDAWKSGASTWNTEKLYRYGNDPYNLLAVDGQANQDKGDSSAAYWVPSSQSYDCEYVARQIGVKSKYQLSVTTAEKQAMLKILHGCPQQGIPQK